MWLTGYENSSRSLAAPNTIRTAGYLRGVNRPRDRCNCVWDDARQRFRGNVSQPTAVNSFPPHASCLADEQTRPTKIINRGAQIIRENRNDDRIRSQLQKMLEDAVSGDSPAHAVPFSACFIQLFRKQYVFV